MIRRAALIFVSALLMAAPAGAEQTLRVAPLPRDGQVLVSFAMAEAFTDELRAAIHSGLTVSFVYRVDLRRGSAVWVDRTIGSAVVTATVRYDNLTRRYHVSRMLDGRIERADITEREETAREWLTTNFDRLPLFRNITLERNTEYYIRVRAHTTPRNAAFLWPWQGHDVAALAKFTFVR